MSKVVTERTEMAKILNFGQYPVLSVDIDNKPFSDIDPNTTFIKGCECRVSWGETTGRYKGMSTRCSLTIDGEEGYSLTTGGCCLKGDYTVEDFLDDIKSANTPLVSAGQVVAIAHYSKKSKIKFVKLMKVSSRIDRHCMTVAKLEEIEE